MPLRATPSISTSRCISRWIVRSMPSTSRSATPQGACTICSLRLQPLSTPPSPPHPLNPPLNGTPHDTGQTMAFFNMQNGDAPLFKLLADQYTMSDNYHQPVMGGTGPDSQPLGFADQIFFSDGNGNPATPPANRIYNPDPQAGTLNLYTRRAQWFNCNDLTQPGIAAVADYLSKLPYAVQTKCGPGQFWQAVNVNPAFTPKGLPSTGLFVPKTMQRSIGDVLSAHNIPWKYYGNGFNNSGTGALSAYCNI